MPYDPNFPSDDQELIGGPFRNQNNALKALIDAQAARIDALQATVTTQAGQITAMQTALNAKPSMDDVNAAINTNSSANCNNIEMFSFQFSDPASKSDLDSFQYGVNQFIMALHRPS